MSDGNRNGQRELFIETIFKLIYGAVIFAAMAYGFGWAMIKCTNLENRIHSLEQFQPPSKEASKP